MLIVHGHERCRRSQVNPLLGLSNSVQTTEVCKSAGCTLVSHVHLLWLRRVIFCGGGRSSKGR